MDTLRWLFDASVFMTRDMCGLWPEWLKAMSVVSNTITAISYLLISSLMIYAVYGRYHYYAKNSKQFLIFQVVLVMFSGFICFCALHHSFYAIGFWKNPYRAMTILVDMPMGIISLASAIAFIPVSKIIIEMDPPEVAREKERVAKEAHAVAMQENARILKELTHFKRNVENVVHVQKLNRLNTLIESLRQKQ